MATDASHHALAHLAKLKAAHKGQHQDTTEGTAPNDDDQNEAEDGSEDHSGTGSTYVSGTQKGSK